MLAVNGLTKRYETVLANDNLSFEVPGGSLAVLLGPNGAGKSTAIKSIAGLLRYQGSITIGGMSNRETAAKRMLGFVPEVPYLYDMLTVWEHMEFIARAYRLDNWKPSAEALIERFELTEQREKLGKELSKGMMQKVSICAALLPGPKVLLLDEPLVGLDPRAIKELKAMLLDERSRGRAILISTHIIDSVEDMWDMALIMKKGVIARNTSKEALEEAGESLEALFFEITEGGE